MAAQHPALKPACCCLLAAFLLSACGGGGSGAAAPPTPAGPAGPAETRAPEGCTAADATCRVVVTAADGAVTVTLTTNEADEDGNTNTRTETVDGTERTVTVTSTAEGHAGRVVSVETLACAGGENCARTSLVEHEYGGDGNEPTATTTTVFAADRSSAVTRVSSGGAGDRLRDRHIVRRAAPAGGAVLGAITDDIVVHPGVQDHPVVSDEQYAAIRAGLAPRENSRLLMGQAVLHLDYDDDDGFAAWYTGHTGDTDLEVELHTENPVCATGGCTYSRLRGGPGLAPSPEGEARLYRSSDNQELLNVGLSIYINAEQSFRDTITADLAAGWNSNSRKATQGVILELLSDLLDFGGAGLSSAYAEDENEGNVAAFRAAADPDGTDIEPTYRFAAAPAAMDDADRNTYTRLWPAEELPRGVLGVGRQAKRIDSYKRLGGRRADADAEPAVAENKVAVRAENYFGWMASSMFTVRRVTAENVDGYDWHRLAGVDPADRVRAHVGMVGGDPSVRPEERRAAGMTDPGTWTGQMIGVGTIQGERYRGDAVVAVDFAANDVTTQFKQIRLDLGGLSDAEFVRFAKLNGAIAPELNDADGITFTSTRIENAGSYASTVLSGATGGATYSSSLSAQFYGPDAAEVAGTFNAHGLAVGGRASDTELTGTPISLTANRGDIVGAFGATRDPMVEAEEN